MQNWKKRSSIAQEAASLLCLRKGRSFAGFENKCLHMNQKSQRLVVARGVPGRIPGAHHRSSPIPRYSPRAHLHPGTAPQLTCAQAQPPSSPALPLCRQRASASLRAKGHLNTDTGGFCVLRPPRAPCSRAQLWASTSHSHSFLLHLFC